MSFVLKLCGWYPSKVDFLNGDFVQRHAISIATQVETVVLFAQKDPAKKTKELEWVTSQQGRLYEYICYYPQRRFADKLWSQYYYRKALAHFIKHYLPRHGVPALVHVNIVWKAGSWALSLLQKYHWPFVVTENSTEYQENALLNIEKQNIFRRNITRSVFKKCLHFIPVSAQLGKRVNQLYGNVPYSVVPNAVDISVFLPKTDSISNVFRLLHVSTMGFQKNITGLLRVLNEFVTKHKNAQITLAGPVDESVLALAASYPDLNKKVTFTGPVSNKRIAALMAESNCLVLFSRYENLPCVILEALCSGLPVISTNVGGIAEVVNDSNGVLVADGDESELLKALCDVAVGGRNFNINTISEDAHRMYNYEQIGKSYYKIYHRILPEKFP